MERANVDYRKIEHRKPPGRSARLFCLQCMGGDSGLVRDCRSEPCLMWPFRFGQGRVTLKTIRTCCLHCQGWSFKKGKLDPDYKDGGQGLAWQEARACTGYDCPLYPYRPGTNPYKGRLGNKDIAKYRPQAIGTDHESTTETIEPVRP